MLLKPQVPTSKLRRLSWHQLYGSAAALALAEATRADQRLYVVVTDDARELEIQEQAVRVAAENNDLTRIQYQDGTVTYLTLLNAQRSYELARLSLVQAQAARLADTAALFQALGGGWWNRTDVIPNKPKPGIIEVISGSLH